MEFNHFEITLSPKYIHTDALEALSELGYIKPSGQLVYYLQPDGEKIHVYVVKPDGSEKKSTTIIMTHEDMEQFVPDDFFVLKLRGHGLDGDIFHPVDGDDEVISENCYVLAEKRRPYNVILSDFAYLVNQAQDYMDPADWARFKAIYNELEQHR